MRPRRIGLLLSLVAAGWIAVPADGYRFIARHGEFRRIASSAAAVRWEASALPLWFRLLDNDNLPAIAGLDRKLWRESVERGLRVWTRIETSSLELGLAEEAFPADQGRAADGIPTIGFSSLARVADGRFATADVLHSRGRITDCDVHISPRYLDGWRDDPALLGQIADHLARTVIHEVGHCLGLAHSVMNPMRLASSEVLERPAGHFPEGVIGLQPDPQMSYGRIATVVLEPDDEVGASLLYPAPGYLESRGALTGRVAFASGEPAPFVYVTSVMDTPAGAVFGPGAFTDEWGQFLLEGLDSGFRHFWIGPLLQRLAHSFTGEASMAGSLEIQHEQRWIEIRPGEITRAPDITMHPAADPRERNP